MATELVINNTTLPKAKVITGKVCVVQEAKRCILEWFHFPSSSNILLHAHHPI